jgi:Zn-dependent oligopeptidase
MPCKRRSICMDLLAKIKQDTIGDYKAINFSAWKESDYLPAFKEAITLAQKRVDVILGSPASFEKTILGLENCDHELHFVNNLFSNLLSAESSDSLRALAKEVSPLVTEFYNSLTLNDNLFQKVKAVYEGNQASLGAEERQLLKKSFLSFSRNGSLCTPEEKEKLKVIDQNLTQLKLKFSDNVLNETNSSYITVDSAEEVVGIPEDVLAAAKEKAIEIKRGLYAFGLDAPTRIAVMTYGENRELRKKMAITGAQIGFLDNEYNNKETIKKIAVLRYERANLLGYKTHADFVLEERMAKTADTVKTFLKDILNSSLPKVKTDVAELIAFAKENYGYDKIYPYDQSFLFEKLKSKKFSLDEQKLRPYFALDNCVQGVFILAKKLYGLSFKEKKDLPVYHQEVTAYEVYDREGQFLSLFYTDFFPRPGKRNGAWMTSFREQYITDGLEHRPHVSIVCNFPRPQGQNPSLLTFNDVVTLFHEFGHALHGMLAKGHYRSLTGTNVYWDFVELPSQILENWVFEAECLDLFAKHYETGEKLPVEWVKKIQESGNFLESLATLRQVSFALLDMAWHSEDPRHIQAETKTGLAEFEKTIMSSCRPFGELPDTAMSTSFGHIFEGGYSAGYYSYKWAEVLDADAFAYFKEKGLFNEEVANKFKMHILERGGTVDPSELYELFRGRGPRVDALLERAGFKEARV